MDSEVEIFKVSQKTHLTNKQSQNFAPTGFPSPAADYLEDAIDIEQYLRPNPTSTFFIRYMGKSMTNAGIYPGSILTIDRSLLPENNQLILAIVNGDLFVKYYVKNSAGIELIPANEGFQTTVIADGMDFSIWGVVTMIITKANDRINRLQ